jgi:hypothetical protein
LLKTIILDPFIGQRTLIGGLPLRQVLITHIFSYGFLLIQVSI